MSNKSLLGSILVGIGIVWLLDNFGVIDAPSFGQWLPIILIAFGVWRLLFSQFKALVESIFFIGSGVTIGLLQLNIITMREVLQAFLPVIVILIGVWVLSSDKQNRIEKREDKEETKS
ncbi:MAG: LiaF transmembrane domain-containing protein [Minisyncoccia bacterium]